MDKNFLFICEGENKKRLFPSLIESIKKNKKFYLKIQTTGQTSYIFDTVVKTIDKLINLKISGEFNICRGKSEKLKNINKIIQNYFKRNFASNINRNKTKIDREEIIGSTKKLKKPKCFVFKF